MSDWLDWMNARFIIELLFFESFWQLSIILTSKIYFCSCTVLCSLQASNSSTGHFGTAGLLSSGMMPSIFIFGDYILLSNTMELLIADCTVALALTSENWNRSGDGSESRLIDESESISWHMSSLFNEFLKRIICLLGVLQFSRAPSS